MLHVRLPRRCVEEGRGRDGESPWTFFTLLLPMIAGPRELTLFSSNKPAARTVGCLPPLLFLSLFCEPGRIIVLVQEWSLLLPTTTTSKSGEGQKDEGKRETLPTIFMPSSFFHAHPPVSSRSSSRSMQHYISTPGLDPDRLAILTRRNREHMPTTDSSAGS